MGGVRAWAFNYSDHEGSVTAASLSHLGASPTLSPFPCAVLWLSPPCPPPSPGLAGAHSIIVSWVQFVPFFHFLFRWASVDKNLPPLLPSSTCTPGGWRTVRVYRQEAIVITSHLSPPKPYCNCVTGSIISSRRPSTLWIARPSYFVIC